jgi:hypothetical protein
VASFKKSRIGLKVITTCIILLMVVRFSIAQSSPNNAAISRLIASLSNHSVSPAKALDPAVTGESRTSELKLLSDAGYELTITPTGEPEWSGDSRVSIPAKVQFKDETTGLDISARVEFVERNGEWYFADYNFLKMPWLFWLFAIAMFAYALLTAATVIVLRRRLVRSGQLRGANYIKIFIPFFWPSLFRVTRRPTERS